MPTVPPGEVSTMTYRYPTRPPVRARDLTAMQRFAGEGDLTWVGVTLYEATLASA